MNNRRFKKLYAICEDDNGKMIYPGDTVEVLIPWETKTPHRSIVKWNPLDGAYIESHPAHLTLDISKHRKLRDYLWQTGNGVPIYDHPDDEKPSKYVKGYCRKVKDELK
jgi:hypothetical protein